MPVTFVTSKELQMPAEDFAPGIVQDLPPKKL